jgi:hypothetical protein
LNISKDFTQSTRYKLSGTGKLFALVIFHELGTIERESIVKVSDRTASLAVLTDWDCSVKGMKIKAQGARRKINARINGRKE